LIIVSAIRQKNELLFDWLQISRFSALSVFLMSASAFYKPRLALSVYFRSYPKATPKMFAVSPSTVNTPPFSPRPVRLRGDCALA
jgi:hypothetical protein